MLGPQNTSVAHDLDLDRLFKLRLTVARYGEMDGAGWWNTSGILGQSGATVLRRGFPFTHFFAQARIAFSVAHHRCNEVFKFPRSVTLWNMPPGIEEEFDLQWHNWLKAGEEWAPFFNAIQPAPSGDLLATLKGLKLVGKDEVDATARLRLDPGGRSVRLPDTEISDRIIGVLAAAFAKGAAKSLAVPYLVPGVDDS